MNESADEPIRIAPYDPEWAARFDRERDLLGGVIGAWVVGDIHHAGSTAALPAGGDALVLQTRSEPPHFEFDREGYTDAKADFIERTLRHPHQRR